MRICEANTRILRASYQPNMDAMPIKLRLPMPRFNAGPKPRGIELCAGRGRKENAASTKGETRFPNGSPGGKRVPESAFRLGRSFRMAPQAETASQNIGSEWDAFSGWVVGGKFIPESALRLGRSFRMAHQAESASRNLASNWDTLSASPAASKNPCALHPKTG